MLKHWGWWLSLLCTPALALEADIKGLVDLRLQQADGLDSYVSAGQGKLQTSHGSQLSLAQLAVVPELSLSDNLTLTTAINSFADEEKQTLGITEAFLRYHGVPNPESGLRQSWRLGVFYPAISLENQAVAWSSPDTLTPSTLNSWIGEEIRTTGFEYSAEWLGKLRQKNYNLKLTGSAFTNNDTAGAMLAWHGWTLSSRQSVLGERLDIPATPAQANLLSEQADASNPFHEGDDKLGYSLIAEWQQPRKLLLQWGYYANNATPYQETHGQYGWDTTFGFGGFRWQIDRQWQLSGQLLSGSTLMQSPQRQNIVENDYRSAYLSLGWKQGPHRINGRIEEFSVTDHDQIAGDNNAEQGKAFSLSYRYRLAKQWFMLGEYNWINSTRPARTYQQDDAKQIETQLQFGVRYYF